MKLLHFKMDLRLDDQYAKQGLYLSFGLDLDTVLGQRDLDGSILERISFVSRSLFFPFLFPFRSFGDCFCITILRISITFVFVNHWVKLFCLNLLRLCGALGMGLFFFYVNYKEILGHTCKRLDQIKDFWQDWWI